MAPDPFKDGNPFSYVAKNHGIGAVAFHRAELLQIIYDNLPESSKAKVLTGKKATDVESNEAGVKVTCADGSVYHGDILLGAGGVHSKTRSLQRKLALEADPKADWDPETPFEATYRCLWCSFKRPSAMGQTFETQDKDRSIMYISGKERGWIFLYEKLPEPTRERVFYTDKDTEAFAERFADWPINDTLKVKDVYSDSLTAGMANLEECIAKNWSWGRVVLAGDSCHKFTPNAGLGLHNGIQDVVALSNGLHEAIAAARSSGLAPSTAALGQVFKACREQRLEELERDGKTSAQLTLHDYAIFDWLAGRSIRKSLVLDYVKADEPFNGQLSWLRPMNSSLTRAG